MRPETPQYPLSPYNEGFDYGLRSNGHIEVQIDPTLAARADFQRGLEDYKKFSSMMQKHVKIEVVHNFETEEKLLESLVRQMS